MKINLFFMISLIIVSIFAALLLDAFYFRKLKRVWRIALIYILILCPNFLVLSIPMIFDKSMDWAVLSVIVVMFFLVASIGFATTYFASIFHDWQIKRLRTKYSKLPDGSQKRILDYADMLAGKEPTEDNQ